jgi:glycosyltransferase involved in cell wall biosynthesis
MATYTILGGSVGAPPKVVILVNVDFFFVSHRLALGVALRRAGFEVVVAAAETDGRRAIEDAGLRFEPLPLQRSGRAPWREAATAAAIVRLYRRERPDVVHHVTIKPVLYGSAAARLCRVPAVINAVTGLGFVFIERAGGSSWLPRAARAGYRLVLRSPGTRVVFQNPDDQRAFVESGLCPAAAATLIRGAGVDTQRFRATPLPDGAPTVVLASRMLWDKGVGELVDAARRLRARGLAARFILVGPLDPDNPAAIPAARLAAWVDEGVVEWWGPRPAADMPAILAGAHVVALPSYREGMPLVLAEAAACARACVATDVPGCREIVRAGATGWLVPPRDAAALADAIAAALGDRAELARRGAEGRALVEKEFALDRVLERTLAVYRDLLGERFPS